jgi:protein-tyrosine-phosphatase
VKDEDFISHEGEMPTTVDKTEALEDQKIDEHMIHLLKKLNIDVTKLKDKQTITKILNDLNSIILQRASSVPSQQPQQPSKKQHQPGKFRVVFFLL